MAGFPDGGGMKRAWQSSLQNVTQTTSNFLGIKSRLGKKAPEGVGLFFGRRCAGLLLLFFLRLFLAFGLGGQKRGFFFWMKNLFVLADSLSDQRGRRRKKAGETFFLLPFRLS